MRAKEFKKVLRKYRKGLCTPEEAALIEEWYNAMEDPKEPLPDAIVRAEIKKRSWGSVKHHMDDGGRTIRFNPGSRPSYRLAAAAVILALLVSFVFLISRSYVELNPLSSRSDYDRNIVNNSATDSLIVLEDGSQVHLRPHSALSVANFYDSLSREVMLDGEAFFEIVRDTLRPFLVYTNGVTTKVLGTSFTVTAFPNDENITVAVRSGKVSVTTPDGKQSNSSSESILTPNQKIVYNKSDNVTTHTLVDLPQPLIPAEEMKQIYFEEAPVAEILHAVEKIYGVDIEFDDEVFATCKLTTSISGESMYDKLDIVCHAVDATYVVHGNKIIMQGAGCGPH